MNDQYNKLDRYHVTMDSKPESRSLPEGFDLIAIALSCFGLAGWMLTQL